MVGYDGGATYLSCAQHGACSPDSGSDSGPDSSLFVGSELVELALQASVVVGEELGPGVELADELVLFDDHALAGGLGLGDADHAGFPILTKMSCCHGCESTACALERTGARGFE